MSDTNSNLITRLVNKNYIKDYAVVLDWLFDDNRIANLDKAQKTRFIKRIKSFNGIKKANYFYTTIKEIQTLKVKEKQIIFIFSKLNGELADLLRHFRNAIAHKKARIIVAEGIDYIECIDYKDSNQATLTARIFMPLSYLLDIYKLYKTILKEYGKRK